MPASLEVIALSYANRVFEAGHKTLHFYRRKRSDAQSELVREMTMRGVLLLEGQFTDEHDSVEHLVNRLKALGYTFEEVRE